ncbi:hypothetical protein [Marinibactrum halimedae]|uniref:hypothetical protein n=1 Tax=Marinibactrum halimedae TaxID=1444977 RepID=UPI001E54C98C|nr:hypothetical protein [Marinibactrum halimedae]MCD9458050.1 hypothetical protein [Marinibactrum halimedae]
MGVKDYAINQWCVDQHDNEAQATLCPPLYIITLLSQSITMSACFIVENALYAKALF